MDVCKRKLRHASNNASRQGKGKQMSMQHAFREHVISKNLNK